MENRLTFSVDSEAPEKAREFAAAFASCKRLGPDEEARLVVIVEELVTNIVKYGYPNGKGPGRATMSLKLQGQNLELEIEDDGQAFDPANYRARDLEAPLDERTEGHLGLHIVQSLAHTMAYRRDGGRNRLMLTRLIDTET